MAGQHVLLYADIVRSRGPGALTGPDLDTGPAPTGSSLHTGPLPSWSSAATIDRPEHSLSCRVGIPPSSVQLQVLPTGGPSKGQTGEGLRTGERVNPTQHTQHGGHPDKVRVRSPLASRFTAKIYLPYLGETTFEIVGEIIFPTRCPTDEAATFFQPRNGHTSPKLTSQEVETGRAFHGLE